MLIIIGIAIFTIIVVYIAIQYIRCRLSVKTAKRKLKNYNASTARLSYGNMTYLDKGEGVVILPIHGIFGGHDQGYNAVNALSATNRIISPSRFGYLNSSIKGNGTPKEQAMAFVELLDQLNIDKAYVLGTSAGGTVAIRFALDYPERTKGLILYCSAPPFSEKPSSYIKHQGPPKFMCNNFAMFLISPFFKLMMGMDSATIFDMLPIDERSKGVHIDATITNPDMAKNFNDYPIEKLKVPTLIFHAKDDKMVPYNNIKKVVNRFPNCTFVTFETGGHMMRGHSEEINKTLTEFVKQ